MGDFVVHIHAVGGHGCQREKRLGDTVGDCGVPNCPDCIIRRAVTQLKSCCSVSEATLTHWPNGSGTVVDNLLSGTRQNSFDQDYTERERKAKTEATS